MKVNAINNIGKKGKCCMMTKTIFKLFWVWQETKEIEWLRLMSKKGWHLKKINIFFYTFQKAEPKDIIYYKDHKLIKRKDVEDYTYIFKDAGWSYICRQGNWFYFSSPAENKFKEVYTDNQSRLNKYGSLLAVHAIILGMLVNVINITSRKVTSNEFSYIDILLFVLFLLLVATTYSTMKLIILTSKLKKNLKE